MTTTQATAEVFMTAFRSLKKKDRQAVLAQMAQDRACREDLIDLSTLAQRKHEKPRDFRGFMAEQARSSKH